MAKFKRQLFVCENSRPPGHPRGCCADRGGVEIRQLLKDGLQMRGLKGYVRASSAGCLDQCARGVTVVVYPDDVWYGNVKPDDVAEILDRHVLKGEVVQRLVIPDHQLTGRERPFTPDEMAEGEG
ncbi:MAG: (2Fe-2S) ferredoxin domain-containing protein [Planctomycetes bacterium]|nr:(2Fe-2S) ferredoxin domain-containing protein [Planctomycetota bacterium]